MPPIPEKLEVGRDEPWSKGSYEEKIDGIIDYLTAREELEDARYRELDNNVRHSQEVFIKLIKELTSRIDTIEGNQLEMKGGKRCPEEDFGFEPKDQPKRWPQHFLQIDPVDGYQIVSYGFETREAAEAYKAKLLADNQQ